MFHELIIYLLSEMWQLLKKIGHAFSVPRVRLIDKPNVRTGGKFAPAVSIVWVALKFLQLMRYFLSVEKSEGVELRTNSPQQTSGGPSCPVVCGGNSSRSIQGHLDTVEPVLAVPEVGSHLN